MMKSELLSSLKHFFKDNRYARRFLIIVAFAMAMIVGFVNIAEEMMEQETAGVDEAVSLWIRQFDTPVLDQVMRAITTLGDAWLLLIVALLVSGWAYARGLKSLTWRMLVLVFVTGALNMGLKMGFNRTRPDLFEEIVAPQSASFPSGHAMGAAVVYGMTAYALAHVYPARRHLVRVAMGLLVVLIGTSRLYLGVHWFSDVIAGFLAGGLLLACHIASLPSSFYDPDREA